MAFKIRIPRIVALEMIDGIAGRAEWDCGCVTIKMDLGGRESGGAGGRGMQPGQDAGPKAELTKPAIPDSAAALPAQVMWTYLERCDAHAKEHKARYGGHILMDPSDLTDPKVRKDWRI